MRTYTGWMARSAVVANQPHEGLMIEEVYACRGKKNSWSDEDWPPVRVRVTVEKIAPKPQYEAIATARCPDHGRYVVSHPREFCPWCGRGGKVTIKVRRKAKAGA